MTSEDLTCVVNELEKIRTKAFLPYGGSQRPPFEELLEVRQSYYAAINHAAPALFETVRECVALRAALQKIADTSPSDRFYAEQNVRDFARSVLEDKR